MQESRTECTGCALRCRLVSLVMPSTVIHGKHSSMNFSITLGYDSRMKKTKTKAKAKKRKA